MRSPVLLHVLVLVVVLVLGSKAAEADTPEKGFKPMFNGRNLNGWVNVNCAPSTFTIRDGMVVSTGKPTGVLRTKRMYENFIVELDWKHIQKGGNAGLFVWSGALPVRGQPFTRAIEVQIIDGDDPGGMWTGQGDVFAIQGATFVPDRPHPGGWMRCLPSERRANPAGQWNHYRVECRDGRVTLAVNGKVVSGGSQCSERKGYICLESEGTECHFKNMRIKELPSSKVPDSQTSEAYRGFVSLYNGIDLRDWVPVTSDVPFGVDDVVKVKDWILAIQRPVWLRSRREFGDFDLMMDFRATEKGANGEFSVVLKSYASGGSLGLVGGFENGPTWRRAVITRRGGLVTMRYVPEGEVGRLSTTLPARVPIIFHVQPHMEFANIYIRKR